jgi:hypothetical protein
MIWSLRFAAGGIALATGLLAGCESTPGPSFEYNLTSDSTIDVKTTGSGAPLGGVVVSVRTPAADPTHAGALLWMGSTGPDGHAHATFRSEQVAENLEVTLHKAGWRGPWSDESARQAQGLFAPSSQLVLPAAQADGLKVDFERTAQ